MTENLENENQNQIDDVVNVDGVTAKKVDSKKKIVIGSAVAATAIFGFMIMNSNSSTSEADCQKMIEPVSNAVAMLTSMEYDTSTQVFVLQSRSEELSSISSQISGPGADIAQRMSSTLAAVASSYSAGNYVGAPSQDFISQVDELRSVCPSIFN